jgi:hypothetical protein
MNTTPPKGANTTSRLLRSANRGKKSRSLRRQQETIEAGSNDGEVYCMAS